MIAKHRVVLTWAILALLFTASASVYAQAPPSASNDRMTWWRDARFGMFIHWGPVSIKGTEIGWSRGGERRGTGGAPGAIPVDVYDNLYKSFNPVEFNAKEWVAIAKKAGMKYLVFTSRHHDGFSMFDTAQSDYKITNSPFKRDVVAELAQACHEAGLRFGLYYSPPDWHHPDYRTERHAKYVEYLHAQIRELCTKYGKLDILWFDGLGGTAKDWDAERLVKMIRELQPGIVINNRAGLPEDHDTPEQTIGQFQNTRPWETCMTICNQWAWKPDDTMKTLDQCLGVLVRCAGGDGNLLFNVGPMPTGAIEPRQVKRLDEMGAWLDQYGESIYGTRGGPFMPCAWGSSTCKGNTIYLHVLKWQDVPAKLVLPKIDAKVVGSRLLTGGEASVKPTSKGLAVAIPESARKAPDTILALELDRPAAGLKPVPMVDVGLFGARYKKIEASNVFQKDAGYGPNKACDGNSTTRWATDGGTQKAWLAIRLDKPIIVGQTRISEACGDRVKEFELQYRKGNKWVPFYKGKTIGEIFCAAFKPVKAREFRLDIKDSSEGPTLWEFQLLPPKK